MKRFFMTLSLGLGVVLFSTAPADAFVGNHWRSRQAGCAPQQGAFYVYSPSAYRSAYQGYGYGGSSYRGYGYSTGLYGAGYRGSYGSGYRGYNKPYSNSYSPFGSYRYSPYSRFGSAAGLMGYGNGYYYGGFPAARASGIGLYPRSFYGW